MVLPPFVRLCVGRELGGRRETLLPRVWSSLPVAARRAGGSSSRDIYGQEHNQ
jgi:hypothetical protein